MSHPPSPDAARLAPGTRVHLADGVRRYGPRLLAGGAPWRLVRLSVGAVRAIHEWQGGAPLRAPQVALARRLVDEGLLDCEYPVRLEPADVDVIVPVRDDPRVEGLLGALSGLFVTLVDDASVDADAVAGLAARHGASLVRLETNLGPGAARNAGLAATSRPLVWFLDADLALEDAHGVLARLARHLADERVGAVAPRVLGPPGRSARERFEWLSSPLDQGSRSGAVRPGAPISYVPAACLLVRRRAIGEGFTTALRVGEDVDLVWRLADEGWIVRYDARVRVAHPARDTWADWLAQRVAYGASAAALASRHGSRVAPLRLNASALGVWSFALSGRVGAAITTGARVRARVARSLGPESAHAGALTARGLLEGFGANARSGLRHFPYVIAAALLARRTRRAALVVLVAGLAQRWRARRPRPLDVGLGLLDDTAYAVGLLVGARRERTLAHLRPTLRRAPAART